MIFEFQIKAFKTEINVTEIKISNQERNEFENFSEVDQVKLNLTNKLNISLEFKPRKRISFLVFNFTTDISKKLLNISIFVNKYRNCFVNPLYVNYLLENDHIQFICQAISLEHHKNEINDLPSSIIAIIKSNDKGDVGLSNNVFVF